MENTAKTTTTCRYVAIDNELGASLHTLEIPDDIIEAGEEFEHAYELCGAPQCLLSLKDWQDAVQSVAAEVSENQPMVYAVWEVVDVPTQEELDALYIQCGVSEADWDSYSAGDKGARVYVDTTGGAGCVRVTFEAPSLGIENEPLRWFSPCTLGEDETEALDFGIRLATKTA